jgi:LEA14-like dessication related protein
MKKMLQFLFALTVGVALIGGLTLANTVNALTDPDSGLNYDIGDFKVHKVDLVNKSMEVKINTTFTNPTNTPIPVTNLLLTINIPDAQGEWRELARSTEIKAFTIFKGKSTETIKFTTPIAREFTNLLPTLIQGTDQQVMVIVYPQIGRFNIEPIKVVETINLKQVFNQSLLSKLGLGYTGEGEKVIIKTDRYDHLFNLKDLKFEDKVISSGSHYGTLDEMKRIVNASLNDTQRLAPTLKQRTNEATIKAVFDFVNDHIQYREDSPGIEELRRPTRSWNDRVAGIDCDCYSILLSSILSNLNIPHSFRMAAYDASENFSHVYVVAKANGKQYIMDPVKGKFNTEHGPITKSYNLIVKS